jgi:hypothetical protein
LKEAGNMSEVMVAKDVKVVPPEEVAKRVVCLRLGFSTFGVRRRVDPRKFVKGPDEALGPDTADAVHMGKDILEAESLDDVRKLSTEARAFIIGQSVPAKFLRGGMYLVPSLTLEATNEKLADLRAKYEVLVDTFVEEYESGSIQRDAERRLAPLGLYDAEDYPSVASVRASFKMRWQWFEFSVPDKLRETNPAIWRAEVEKTREMWAEAAAEIKTGLREGIAAIVAKLVARLEPGDDGKRKIIKASALEPLAEFVESFPFKNVTGDEELRSEVEKLRALTRGVDIDDVKKYGGLRRKLQTDLATVASRLEKLVEEAPERRISFEDE